MKHTRLIKHVVEDTDRHGNVRIYFRRKGHPKVRLPGPVGSPEFEAAYAAALDRSFQLPREQSPDLTRDFQKWPFPLLDTDPSTFESNHNSNDL
jgi:hypothetical protein